MFGSMQVAQGLQTTDIPISMITHYLGSHIDTGEDLPGALQRKCHSVMHETTFGLPCAWRGRHIGLVALDMPGPDSWEISPDVVDSYQHLTQRGRGCTGHGVANR
jgi:hypothetical protein